MHSALLDNIINLHNSNQEELINWRQKGYNQFGFNYHNLLRSKSSAMISNPNCHLWIFPHALYGLGNWGQNKHSNLYATKIICIAES